MAKDQLVTWLNDAHAMEHGLIPVLERHALDAETHSPQMAARIRQHIEETRGHADRLVRCLRELGTGPSTLKSAFASMLGSAQGFSTGMFPDEPLRNVMVDYATEQFEVACYRALSIAAREQGFTAVAQLCEANLREDEQMALWLADQLPATVRQAIARAAASR